MRSRRPILARARRAGALLVAAPLALAPGCASWNPFAAPGDPMQAEMRRLEREQREAMEERALFDAQQRERRERPKTLEERIREGDRYLDAGQMAGALWEYAAAHKLDPASPEPRVRLGYVHLRADPQRARPLFESALDLDPDHVHAHLGLGLSMFAGGDREDGLAHLERAVALAPESARAREALGVRLDQVGRLEEAGRHLEKARALRPHDGRILNNLGFYHLRHGDHARAESLFRAALREDTRDTKVRSRNLGMALAMQGRFDEALAAFRKAGDEQSARSNLGYAHQLRGEYAEAIAQYEEALVAGGEASLQVVRNLESAKRSLGAVGSKPSPPSPVAVEGPEEAGEEAAGPGTSLAEGGHDAGENPAAQAEDPWQWGAPASGDGAE